jgi:hypothetical protein
MTRNELNFASLSQLSGYVLDDWDEAPVELSKLHHMLLRLDTCDTVLQKYQVIGLLTNLQVILNKWENTNKDNLLSELRLRLTDYEREVKRNTSPA